MKRNKQTGLREESGGGLALCLWLPEGAMTIARRFNAGKIAIAVESRRDD
jgi:hypothetical protein